MISIVTVCHRSDALLAKYVETFLGHHTSDEARAHFEFVLVENSGDPATQEHARKLEEHGFSAKFLQTENRGFGAGCNAGAALASGELLAFVNPDIEFEGSLAPLRDFFGTSRWGSVLQTHGKTLTSPLGLRTEHCNLFTDLAMTRRWLHFAPVLHRFAYPSGSFFVVPKADFDAVGGFDERFFLYQEEVELSRRLVARLGAPRICRTVKVLHKAFGSEPSEEFTLRHEAISTVLYGQIIGDPGLAKRRLGSLRMTRRLIPINARRAAHLEQAIAEGALP
ncbi:MAG: glycosyltransferase [Pseudomonadota bacterium]